MTREEQIKKQADIYTDDASNYAEWSDDGGWSSTNDIELVEKAFIASAKWADKTMIDKAVKWLQENTYKHVDDRRLSMLFSSQNEMIESFRKAMEE